MVHVDEMMDEVSRYTVDPFRKTMSSVKSVFLNKKKLMDKYNKVDYIKLSHNCYAFVMDALDHTGIKQCKSKNDCRKPQPGYVSGIEHWSSKDLKCDEVMKRVIADSNNTIYIPKVRIKGTQKYKYGNKCKKGYYRGVLVIAPDRDYHFYREVQDGEWLHKRGQTEVTDVDASGNKITDPFTANRDYGGDYNYHVFCCYFCIPINASKRQVSSFVRKVQKKTEEYIKNTQKNEKI